MRAQLKQGPSLPAFRQDEVSMYSALEYRVLLRRRAKVCAARTSALVLHCNCSTLGLPSSHRQLPRQPKSICCNKTDDQNRALPLAVLGAGSFKHSRVCYAKVLHRFDNDVSTRQAKQAFGTLLASGRADGRPD